MKIINVKAAGFRGIKGQIELNFPDGFAVITGSNGAGKSTICDAIEFAISGSLTKNNPGKESGETISEYVWWRGKERPQNRFVIIELESKSGEKFKIERTPQGLNGITQEKITELLCDRNSRPNDSLDYLVRTAVIRGEQIAELSLDLPETERFNFVKACLGERDHSDIENAASNLSKVFKTRVEKLEIEYQKGRFRITEITTRTSVIRAQAAKVEEVSEAEGLLRGSLNLSTGELTELLRIARSEVGKRRANAESLLALSRQLSSIDQRLSAANTTDFTTRLANIESSLRLASRKRNEQQIFAQSLEEKIKLTSANSNNIEHWAALHEHGAALSLQDGKCPLCASKIGLTEFQQRLDQVREHIGTLNKESANLLRQRSQVSDQLRRLTEEANSLEREFKDLSSLTELLRKEKNNLVQSLSERGFKWPENPDLAPQMLLGYENELRDQAVGIEKALAVLDSSRSLGQVAELERELTKCQSDSEALAKLISKTRSAEERFKEAAATVKRVSAELVDERLAELSPLLTELYTRLKPHVDWTTVSYIMRGDVRRFLSLRVGEDLNPRFMFSNGQRRAAGLAFLLAVHLSRSWCLLNSLVLDDPVQHIDDFRALHLVEVLSAIRQTGRQIICTIEDPELAKLLCRRLRSLAGQEGVLVTLDYEPEEGVKLLEQKSIFSLPKMAILAA